MTGTPMWLRSALEARVAAGAPGVPGVHPDRSIRP